MNNLDKVCSNHSFFFLGLTSAFFFEPTPYFFSISAMKSVVRLLLPWIAATNAPMSFRFSS